MAYTPLTDPFVVRFDKGGVEYVAHVVYAKSDDCCDHFFDVNIQKPEGVRPFHLKEKPTSDRGAQNIIWIDQNDHVNLFYQVLGYEIEQYLRKNMGIVLIDAPLPNRNANSVQDKHEL